MTLEEVGNVSLWDHTHRKILQTRLFQWGLEKITRVEQLSVTLAFSRSHVEIFAFSFFTALLFYCPKFEINRHREHEISRLNMTSDFVVDILPQTLNVNCTLKMYSVRLKNVRCLPGIQKYSSDLHFISINGSFSSQLKGTLTAYFECEGVAIAKRKSLFVRFAWKPFFRRELRTVKVYPTAHCHRTTSNSLIIMNVSECAKYKFSSCILYDSANWAILTNCNVVVKVFLIFIVR